MAAGNRFEYFTKFTEDALLVFRGLLLPCIILWVCPFIRLCCFIVAYTYGPNSASSYTAKHQRRHVHLKCSLVHPLTMQIHYVAALRAREGGRPDCLLSSVEYWKLVKRPLGVAFSAARRDFFPPTFPCYSSTPRRLTHTPLASSLPFGFVINCLTIHSVGSPLHPFTLSNLFPSFQYTW